MEHSMRSTIHPIQSSRSDGSFLNRSSVEVLQMSEINENTSDNLNNFVSLCPIGIVFHLTWSPQCALQFIPNNRLDPRAPSQTVLDSKSFKLAKLAKFGKCGSGRYSARHGRRDISYHPDPRATLNS